jgi:hypothetical protein
MLVMGDESWFQYHFSEKKRQSIQWEHDGSPRLKKFGITPFAGKMMATIFWDMEGMLMVEWLSKRREVNSAICCVILTCLC